MSLSRIVIALINKDGKVALPKSSEPGAYCVIPSWTTASSDPLSEIPAHLKKMFALAVTLFDFMPVDTTIIDNIETQFCICFIDKQIPDPETGGIEWKTAAELPESVDPDNPTEVHCAAFLKTCIESTAPTQVMTNETASPEVVETQPIETHVESVVATTI